MAKPRSFDLRTTAARIRLAALVTALRVLGLTAGGPHAACAQASDPRADVVVYGDHVPPHFAGGAPFGVPFDFREAAPDRMTRFTFETVPGMRNAAGSFAQREATFGKYVIVGNGHNSEVADQQIGIFDSERKTFCVLDVDPAVRANATQRTIITADPGGRRSRIFFAGDNWGHGAARGVVFGYILADLDVDDPCSWRVVPVSTAQLNAGLLPARQLCPRDACEFDGMGLLAHEDVPGEPFGRDFVTLGDYYSQQIAVVRIDGQGVSTRDTYWPPQASLPAAYGNRCFSGSPVQLPSTELGRPPHDRRFVVSYDFFCRRVYDEDTPATCAAPRGYCPLDPGPDGVLGSDCSASGVCAQRYCERASQFIGYTFYASCATDADCVSPAADLGRCVETCAPGNPYNRCEGSGRYCTASSHCTFPEKCSCQDITPKTSQELRFDETTDTLSATSPYFLGTPEPGTSMAVRGYTHDSAGSPWFFHVASDGSVDFAIFEKKTAADSCMVDGRPRPAVDGEHCYYDPSTTDTTVVVPPDRTLPFDYTRGPYEFGSAVGKVQVGATTYIVGRSSVQRAQLANGRWVMDDPQSYKVGLAPGLLPAEPKACSGGVCQALEERAAPERGKLTLSVGGAPVSLWTTPEFYSGGPAPATNLYLLRIPITTDLPDGAAETRPAMAWSGDRLWLVARHDGALAYRIRDDGLWSAWYALPPDARIAGDVALIADGGSVEVFARGAVNRRIHVTQLVSDVDCAPGSCAWADWQPIPFERGLRTVDGPAAASGGAGDTLLVVRSAATSRLFFAVRSVDGWSRSWTAIPGLRTRSAPAVAWNSADQTWWITALGRNGQIRYTRLAPDGLPERWTDLGSGQVPWAAAPAIVFDGLQVRAYAPAEEAPGLVHQTVGDEKGFDRWAPMVSEVSSTRQPAATVVNGDVNLVTNGANGLQEALAK